MNWRFWNRAGQDDCAAIEPLLSLYSDDMASPQEVHRIESHLPDCPDCRQALVWMEATRLAVSRRPAPAPPADLRVRIARAIAEADAAKAPAAQTPAAPAPRRPIRRPLTLRPALAYGLSLVLFAGVTAEVLRHAAHPVHTQIASRPKTVSPAPKVASNVLTPDTSEAVSHVFGQVNATFHSALIGRPVSLSAHHLTVHHAPTTLIARLPMQTAPTVRMAAQSHTRTLPHLSPLPRKTFTAVLHVAAKPPAEHSALVIKPVISMPHPDNSQVATANVPTHEEMHTPTVTPAPPVQVRVGAPTVTHDPSQVAVRAPSLREVLIHVAANMQTVRLSSNARAVNAATTIATSELTDRSLTADLVRGPVH